MLSVRLTFRLECTLFVGRRCGGGGGVELSLFRVMMFRRLFTFAFVKGFLRHDKVVVANELGERDPATELMVKRQQL